LALPALLSIHRATLITEDHLKVLTTSAAAACELCIWPRILNTGRLPQVVTPFWKSYPRGRGLLDLPRLHQPVCRILVQIRAEPFPQLAVELLPLRASSPAPCHSDPKSLNVFWIPVASKPEGTD
jgi:hypothetical protein